MKKKLNIGDVIYLTDISDTCKFEVVKVTPKVAYVEERSTWDNKPIEPGLTYKFEREYDETVLPKLGWKFYEVRNKPYNKWWLQAGVEAK